MCIAIIKTEKNIISRSTLKKCASINPDGLGIFWLDTGEIQKFRSKDYSYLETTRPFIAHFRLASVGDVRDENIHPFRIKGDEYLFQNGTNHNLGDIVKTDTEHLAELLRKVPKNLWRDVLELTESRYITVNSRSKTFEVYNPHKWHKVKKGTDKALYSNKKPFQKYEYNSYNYYSSAGGWSHERPSQKRAGTIIGVYGTLKEGFGNHHLISESTFISEAETIDFYPLIDRGLPYLIPDIGQGYNVHLELYEVDSKTLAAVDRLEGHPNFYRREKIEVLDYEYNIIEAWVYFCDMEYTPDECIEVYTGHRGAQGYIDTDYTGLEGWN